jgi:hypothetical protein
MSGSGGRKSRKRPSLRAADACQLAAVLVATQEDPHRISMVCFDQSLKNAAVKEGFLVNP